MPLLYEIFRIDASPRSSYTQIVPDEPHHSAWELDPDAYRRAMDATERREQAEGAKFPNGKPFPVVHEEIDLGPDLPPNPQHFFVNDRPVMLLPLPDGGLDVQALNMRTGTYERAMEYLSRCIGGAGDVEEVQDEAAFLERVQAIRTLLAGASEKQG